MVKPTENNQNPNPEKDESEQPPSKLDRPDILNVIFYPRKENITPLPPSCIDVEIPLSSRATVLGCRFHVHDKNAPTLLYFHGNGETVSDYDLIGDSYCAEGMNIFIASYRGYGWSTGEPTVSTLLSDSGEILEFLQKFFEENGFVGPLFLMGRSLGSASAIDLAYRTPDVFKGLIIESGFAETLPLLEKMGLHLSENDISEEECFDNIGKIKEISIPTLIYHGSRDELIPVVEAERLQSESGAKNKQFHMIPGADHNSLLSVAGRLYFQTIKQFIDKITGNNSWRRRRREFRNNEKE